MALRTDIYALRHDLVDSAGIFRLARQQDQAYNAGAEILNRTPAIPKMLSPKAPNALFGHIKHWLDDGRREWGIPYKIAQQGFDEAYKANVLMRRAYAARCYRIADYEQAVANGDKKAKLRKADARPCRRTLKLRRRKGRRSVLSVPWARPQHHIAPDRFVVPDTRGRVTFRTRRPVPMDADIRSFRLVEIGEPTSRTKAGDRRYALHLTVSVPDVPTPDPAAIIDDPSEMIGVDIGVKSHWALSDGEHCHFDERVGYHKFRRQQKQLDAKKKGSKRRRKLAKRRRAQSRRRIAERKRQFQHHAIYAVGDAPRGQQPTRPAVKAVVLERLDVRGMGASAAGTKENPGKGVAQKRGLNREWRAAAPAQKVALLRAQAVKRGIPVILVTAAWSSQTCSRCGHWHPSDRDKQAFRCCQCGFTADADFNGSVVIRNRGFVRAVQPDAPMEVAATGRSNQPSRRGQQRLFAARRETTQQVAVRAAGGASRQRRVRNDLGPEYPDGERVGAQIRMRSCM